MGLKKNILYSSFLTTSLYIFQFITYPCVARVLGVTPHIMEDIPNTTSELRTRFAELQEAYKGSVVLHLAAENMIDALFEERFRADDLLPLGPEGRHLLVETFYFNPPMGLYSLLERIKSKGYHPVLAHPERYLYMSMEDYRKLK